MRSEIVYKNIFSFQRENTSKIINHISVLINLFFMWLAQQHKANVTNMLFVKLIAKPIDKPSLLSGVN